MIRSPSQFRASLDRRGGVSSPIPRRATQHQRRGSILVAAIWIIIVLVALLLVFAQEMRVDSIASSNSVAAIKADAIERGAEQFVLSQLDGSQLDAVTISQIPGEQLQLGDGYFWLLRPNLNDVQHQTYDFGIIDESAKVNVNSAPSAILQNLPCSSSSQQIIAESIIDWRSATMGASSNGAESSYYNSLNPPYNCKNAPFETVGELELVRGFSGTSPDPLYGYDVNRNGVLDPAEQQAAGMLGSLSTSLNGADTSLGMYPYVTIYSKEPNRSATGITRININGPTATSSIQQRLNGLITAKQLTAITNAISQQQRVGRQFNSTLQLYFDAVLSPNDWDQVSDYLTINRGPAVAGLIDVNTAPRAVLATLPLLAADDPDTIISARQANTSHTSLSWLINVLPRAKVLAIAPYITNRSFQFSADIVACTGDGRAFKRVRIVVDTTTTPASIVYRQDLTSLGWPLPSQIRQSLRQGQGPGQAFGITGGGSGTYGGGI